MNDDALVDMFLGVVVILAWLGLAAVGRAVWRRIIREPSDRV